MSKEEALNQAREIRRRMHDLEITPNLTNFLISPFLSELGRSMDGFTRAEATGEDVLKWALAVVEYYSKAVSRGELQEGPKLIGRYEELTKRFNECREEKAQLQKDYEELTAQYQVLKGRYEELAKIYEMFKQTQR